MAAAPPLFVARAVEGGFVPEPGAAREVLALVGGEAVAVVAGPTPDGWCSGYRLAAPGAVGWVSAHYLVEEAAEPGGGGGGGGEADADADATESDDSDDGADDEATVLRGAEQSAALVREFHRVDWGEPQPAAAARYPTLSCTLLRSEAGFGLTLDGQLRVTGVVAGAGAALAGVAPGMQLVELQGRPLDTEAGRRDAKVRLKTEARVQALFRCELSPRARPPRTEPAAPAPDLQNDTETDSDGDDDSFATAPGEAAAASQPAPRPAPAPSPVGGSRRPGAVSRSPRVPGATRGLGSRRPATTAAVGTPAPLAPRSAAAPEAGAVGATSQPAGVARRPSALRQPAASLPAGWRMEASKSTGLNYYYNTLTGQSTFERPSEPAAAQGEAAPTESTPAAAEGTDEDDDDAIPEISLAHKTRRALIALADAEETEAQPSEGVPPTGAVEQAGQEGQEQVGSVESEAPEHERASDILAADADAAPAAPSQSAAGGTRRRRGGGLFCCGAPQGGGREEETPRDAELPPGWKTAVSRSSGELYWISDQGESTYHRPAVPPPGWTVQISRSSGDIYYYNVLTGESSYDVPE